MSDARLISVVIPTYNRADRLRVALDAVSAQQDVDIEVIVVDNNSKDSTAQLVQSYPDPRVKYTLCAEQGIYPALNHGFAQAKGDYLTWTSDDNWFHPGALKDMQAELESSGADFVYSDYVTLDETTGRSETTPALEPEDLDLLCCIGPCFLYRRAVYERLGGYDARYRWAADYDWWLAARLAGFTMRRMPSPRYTFTCHETSATKVVPLGVEAEARRVRLARGCYPRLWARERNPVHAADDLRDVATIWRSGHRREALSLAGRLALRWFWSPSFWARTARRCGRALTGGPPLGGR